MRIKVLRRKARDAEPYWEVYDYKGSKAVTIAGLLEQLNNDDTTNTDGVRTARIAWDCSCLQGECGACAMVINGRPGLACGTFLRDLKGDELVIRPLGKFPVIRDLIVDRSRIYESLKNGRIFTDEYRPETAEDYFQLYDIARCLKCGLCLEVCPNYTSGNMFYGALFANDCRLVLARDTGRAGEMNRTYREHFGNACSKSLSCMNVCPVNIRTLASMAKMNRKRLR